MAVPSFEHDTSMVKSWDMKREKTSFKCMRAWYISLPDWVSKQITLPFVVLAKMHLSRAPQTTWVN